MLKFKTCLHCNRFLSNHLNFPTETFQQKWRVGVDLAKFGEGLGGVLSEGEHLMKKLPCPHAAGAHSWAARTWCPLHVE